MTTSSYGHRCSLCRLIIMVEPQSGERVVELRLQNAKSTGHVERKRGWNAIYAAAPRAP